MALTTAAVIGLGIAGAGMYASSRAQNRMTRANARMSAAELAFRKEQQAKLDKQKELYKKFEFKNPYADMQNQYAENVYEDLTINQQQAQFQAQQGAQQRANIMQSLRGAAGGSGVAGLAQALANQGQLQAQGISASIGQQESINQRLRAQGAQQVQAGAAAVDLSRRGGEATMQEAEMSRQSTLLGVAYGGLSGANAGVQAAMANQRAGYATAAQMTADRWNTASNIVSKIDWE